MRVVTAKVGGRVHSGGSNLLNIIDLVDGGVDLFSSTLECDDGSEFGKFRVELRDDEVSDEESETESDGDTIVLDKAVRKGVREY